MTRSELDVAPVPAAAIKLLEIRAEELYRLLLPYSRTMAAGVLSALLSAAEQLREGIAVGQQAVNANVIIDATIGRPQALVLLQLHREEPALRADSPPLEPGRLGELLRAVRDAERGPEDEAVALMRALPPHLEAWLGRAADEARASASQKEVGLWGDRESIVVAAELLVVALRVLLRELAQV